MFDDLFVHMELLFENVLVYMYLIVNVISYVCLFILSFGLYVKEGLQGYIPLYYGDAFLWLLILFSFYFLIFSPCSDYGGQISLATYMTLS